LKIVENDVKGIVCFEGSVKCTTFGRLVIVAPLYAKNIIHLFKLYCRGKEGIVQVGFPSWGGQGRVVNVVVLKSV
jgi:hypothetical protein